MSTLISDNHFSEVLSKMPNQFTTGLFIKVYLEMNMPALRNMDNVRTDFLKRNCIHMPGKQSKTWRKKQVFDNQSEGYPANFNESMCIQFLKDSGYKIYKEM